MTFRMILLAGAALFAPPAWAQRTVIVPDAAGHALATGTTAVRSGAVTTIGGGTLAGTNLFHSFATFNLASGDTARWTTTLTDPAKVTNVINRVTGGTASQINGALDSTDLPKAAFFFINPAGIVFGKDAQVNVPGAAWFSTGKQLRFADGAVFSATTASGSTLSVAAPQGFGFLGQEGDITLERTSALMANPASGLGLAGANVHAEDANIAANQIMFAAVGNKQVDFALADREAAPEALTGSISLARSYLTIIPTNGDPGRLDMNAGKIDVSGGSFLSNSGCVSVNDCQTELTSGSINMLAKEVSLRNKFVISTSTFSTGAAGNINIKAKLVYMLSTKIVSQTVGCKLGQCIGGAAGKISINANLFTMLRDSKISTRSFNSTPAGAILIESNRAEILGRSGIISDSRTGAAGKITIDLKGGDGILRFGVGGIISTSSGPGKAGVITINAPRAVVSNGGSILANGAEGGADVRIASRYFIRSTDRPNRISLNGSIVFDSTRYDVSVGTAVQRVEFLDASNILLGQCASARVTGVTSQMRWHNTGPYADPLNRGRPALSSLANSLDSALC